LFLPDPNTFVDHLSPGAGAASSYPSISPNDLLALNIVLPKNKTILKGFNSTATVAAEQLWLDQEQNQLLSPLRDWLLPMLMNGQVTVK
jgi:type I restriction enzyme S subunit